MSKKTTNYFLSISFEWKDIFKILEVPQEEQDDFAVTDKYFYQSPNANDGTDLGINDKSAIFEYYVLPNSAGNGKYLYSSIFDQQLKRFSESPNINYGQVLKGNKNEGSSVVCFFNKNVANHMTGFAISYSGQDKWKAVIFLFNENYLNLEEAHLREQDAIPFESFEIYSDGMGDNVVRKLSINPESLYIGTSCQSYDDAQISPFGMDLHRYFKK